MTEDQKRAAGDLLALIVYEVEMLERAPLSLLKLCQRYHAECEPDRAITLENIERIERARKLGREG